MMIKDELVKRTVESAKLLDSATEEIPIGIFIGEMADAKNARRRDPVSLNEHRAISQSLSFFIRDVDADDGGRLNEALKYLHDISEGMRSFLLLKTRLSDRQVEAYVDAALLDYVNIEGRIFDVIREKFDVELT